MAMTVAISSAVSERAPFQLRTILAPLVAIVIGAFMVMLDSTAMNVAVPGLVSDLHSTLPMMQWTITGYALVQAAVIPLAGWLSDRCGARASSWARSCCSRSDRSSALRRRAPVC